MNSIPGYAINLYPFPHYVTAIKGVSTVGAVNGTTVWTPAAGKRILITHVTFTTSLDAKVTIFKDTDVAANRLFNQQFAATSGVSVPLIPPFLCGKDEVLKVTTDAGNLELIVQGIEI